MIHPPFTLRAYEHHTTLRGQSVRPAPSMTGELDSDGSALTLELARRFALSEMMMNEQIDQISVFDSEGQEVVALYRNQDGTASWERLTPD